MANCGAYTISEGVEKYLNDRFISKKKFFGAYVNIAKDTWQDIFRNTIWEVQSRWVPLKGGEPYNYIEVPKIASRILGVSVEDHCGLLQPLFYNNQLNIVPQPAVKKCSCTACDCGGLCADVNSFSVTTNLVFTINGVPYYEKIWRESCPNGDILEYKEIPTKKYNNIVGDGGDFNDDYNNDYDIAAAPFSDYTIVTTKQQKKICKLETLPCGCVAETEENAQILSDTCGCNLNWGCGGKKRHCKRYDENINNNYLGEIHFSECKTKIFYKPSKHWKKVTNKEFPNFLSIDFQTNGMSVDAETTFPDYCIDAMTTGIDWRSKRFNNKYSQGEVKAAEYRHIDACLGVVKYLNPISLIELSKVQDQSIKW